MFCNTMELFQKFNVNNFSNYLLKFSKKLEILQNTVYRIKIIK